jgi:hypothetical protein
LTVSEIFPMETRALAIAFFYAVGTAVGGIAGPLLFGQMINSGDRGLVALSFLIGAAVMAIAGVVEVWLGVSAEQKRLEDVALPLTVADAEREEPAGVETAGPAVNREQEAEREARKARIAARTDRHRAEQSGLRRYRPGPMRGESAAWREPPTPGAAETALDQEIEAISRAVQAHRSTDIRNLHREVGARYWGPGEFRRAIRESLAESRIVRMGRHKLGVPDSIGQR